LNNIEEKFLKLYRGEITEKDFERWIYENEIIFSKDLYEDLIILNYNSTETKHELAKLLEINFEKLIRAEIKGKLDQILKSEKLVLQEVESMMNHYDTMTHDFSMKIGDVYFCINCPFEITNINKLSRKEKENSFIEKFKNPRLFLNVIKDSLSTESIRIRHSKITMEFDKKMRQTQKDEYRLLMSSTTMFIKKEYLLKKMKKAWP